MADDLYIMQNVETGNFKVGRSEDPKGRRRTIENVSGMQVELVLVLKGEGHRECEIHTALQRYRLKGEWFRNTMVSRVILQEAIDLPIVFKPIETLELSEEQRLQLMKQRLTEWWEWIDSDRKGEPPVSFDGLTVEMLTPLSLDVAIALRKQRLMDEAKEIEERVEKARVDRIALYLEKHGTKRQSAPA